MAPPEITQHNAQIEQLVKEGLNAWQIYMFINLNYRAQGLSDVISYSTVYRRVKELEKKYRPWKATLLPHEQLFRVRKVKK